LKKLSKDKPELHGKAQGGFPAENQTNGYAKRQPASLTLSRTSLYDKEDEKMKRGKKAESVN